MQGVYGLGRFLEEDKTLSYSGSLLRQEAMRRFGASTLCISQYGVSTATATPYVRIKASTKSPVINAALMSN
jgi:hypothetical protein